MPARYRFRRETRPNWKSRPFRLAWRNSTTAAREICQFRKGGGSRALEKGALTAKDDGKDEATELQEGETGVSLLRAKQVPTGAKTRVLVTADGGSVDEPALEVPVPEEAIVRLQIQ